MADGRILDLFWSFDRHRAVYLNIHGRESTDHGRTWSALWDTGVPGQPGPPLQLSDGRLIMVTVDREGLPAIKMRTSCDDGRTWPSEDEITLTGNVSTMQQDEKASMQDAWAEMGNFSLGLPDTALLSDDHILVVYYGGEKADHTGIYWVRVGP